jgi:hypothetical protein
LPRLSSLVLCDEMGVVLLYSLTDESVSIEVPLAPPASKIVEMQITESHREPMLGALSMCRCHLDGQERVWIHFPRNAAVRSYRLQHNDSVASFVGHEQPVVTVGVMPEFWVKGLFSRNSSSSDSPPGSSSSSSSAVMGFSREEMLLLSVDTNGLRGFSEYEMRELFSFRQRSSMPDISAALFLWDLNRVALGHEQGSLSLMSTESGAILHATGPLRSCIAEDAMTAARLGRGYYLLAADADNGRLAAWNLSLLRKHPSQLSLESAWNGAHDPSDPGILSLCFHEASSTLFRYIQ